MKRLKNMLGVFWSILGPLMVYEVIVGAVYTVLLICIYQQVSYADSFFMADRFGMLEQQFALPISALGAAAAAVPLGGWYLYWRHEVRNRKEALRQRHFGVSSMLLLSGLGASASILGNAVIMEIPFSWDSYEEVSEALYTPPLMVQMVCVGLVVPFVEELVFRGLGYERIRRRIPKIPAVIFTAVFFGFFHGNLIQGIYAGSLGLFLAGVMEWYERLTAPYMLHASANMTSVLLSNTIIGALIGGGALLRRIMIFVFILMTGYLIRMIRKDGEKYETVIDSDTML